MNWTEITVNVPQEFCDTALSCGGCVYRHITYEHELELKRRTVIVKHAIVRENKIDKLDVSALNVNAARAVTAIAALDGTVFDGYVCVVIDKHNLAILL